MQYWIDILTVITTFISVIAAVLAWVAKIRWSSEYAAAKDEIIRAKEAQIKVLEAQIESLKELNPQRLQEYHKVVTSELEQYNDLLKEQVTLARNEIQVRNIKIEELYQSGTQQEIEITKLKNEKEQLTYHIETLNQTVNEIQETQSVHNPDSKDYQGISGSIQEVISSTDSIINHVDTSNQIFNLQDDNRRIYELIAPNTSVLSDKNIEVIKAFRDNTLLVYDRGRFDNFNVSFYGNTTQRYIYSPTHVQLLDFFVSLGDNMAVWSIVQQIGNKINSSTDLSKVIIPTLNGTIEEEKHFYALAAIMLAEEKRQNTRLGKRVVLLECYQSLVLDVAPLIAANWSRGKKWTAIDKECTKYGF